MCWLHPELENTESPLAEHPRKGPSGGSVFLEVKMLEGKSVLPDSRLVATRGKLSIFHCEAGKYVMSGHDLGKHNKITSWYFHSVQIRVSFLIFKESKFANH